LKNKILALYVVYWGFIIVLNIVICPHGLFENVSYGKELKGKAITASKVKIYSSLNSIKATKLTEKPTTKPSITIKPPKEVKPSRSKRPEVTQKPVKPTKIPKFQGDRMTYTVSAYDLSVASCGKSRSSKGFGMTASGFSLRNLSRSSAMTIAADTRILRMGARVFIEFKSTRLQGYNGYYTVRDTGGAIHGYKLDLFMGDSAHQEAMDFGVQKALVRVVK